MSTDKWKKENSTQYLVRISNSSGIPKLLAEIRDKTGIAGTEYIRKALREKLIREGYLPENHSAENPK